jgi:hypothetical protein
VEEPGGTLFLLIAGWHDFVQNLSDSHLSSNRRKTFQILAVSKIFQNFIKPKKNTEKNIEYKIKFRRWQDGWHSGMMAQWHDFLGKIVHSFMFTFNQLKEIYKV